MNKTNNFKMNWDFSALYKSDTDPKLEVDISLMENKFNVFSKKYSNKKFLNSTKSILASLKDWEKLQNEAGFAKPVWYLERLNDTDSENVKRKARSDLFMARVRKAGNEVIFYTLSLSKIDAKTQKLILADKAFAPYKYYLKKLFESGKHLLTEAEEKIINLKNQVTYDMWVDAQSNLLSKQTVSFKGKDIPVSEAMMMRSQLGYDERHELHNKIIPTLKGISHMAEAELVAIYTDKKIDDELRGYKNAYQATVEDYENDLDTVENLVKVINSNMGISHKFFKARASLLGLKKLGSADLYAPIVKSESKKLSTEEILNKTIEGFEKIKPVYADYVRNYAKNGQIDFLPRKGKRGGAYCASGNLVPTAVMMNVTGSIDDICTLSHEMGHAIHAELSKSQSIFYSGHTISVAEVASTFFEQLVIDDLIENAENDQEKLRLLDEKMKGDIGTIFRQISYFNYELKLHNKIRTEGGASKEEMAAMFLRESRNFVGPVLAPHEDDGYSFIYLSHLRYFFYVYSYALGQIISRSLCAKYKVDNSFIEKVEDFLRAGQSMSPRDIFLKTGIDIADPKFIQTGLDAIAEDVKKYEEIIKKINKTRKK
ncbi:MAG: M3 family metallopeptidase [bacterium]